jgi:hypothetical protein
MKMHGSAWLVPRSVPPLNCAPGQTPVTKAVINGKLSMVGSHGIMSRAMATFILPQFVLENSLVDSKVSI